jgi:hypothetical protein
MKLVTILALALFLETSCVISKNSIEPEMGGISYFKSDNEFAKNRQNTLKDIGWQYLGAENGGFEPITEIKKLTKREKRKIEKLDWQYSNPENGGFEPIEK